MRRHHYNFSGDKTSPALKEWYSLSSYLSQWEHWSQLFVEQDPSRNCVGIAHWIPTLFTMPWNWNFSSFTLQSKSASDPAPDDTVGNPTPVTPSEDLCLYGGLMLQMAEEFKIDVMTSDKRPKDQFLSHHYSEIPNTVVFSILGLSDLSIVIWKWAKSKLLPQKIIEEEVSWKSAHAPSGLFCHHRGYTGTDQVCMHAWVKGSWRLDFFFRNRILFGFGIKFSHCQLSNSYGTARSLSV